jgi:hypothetical protein
LKFIDYMMLVFQNSGIFMWALTYQLGSVRWELSELKAGNLLASSVETLSGIGYKYCLGLGPEEDLLGLAAKPLASVVERNPDPRALIFQHCHAQSAVLPWRAEDLDIASRNQYFPAALMKQLHLDDIPYFCSFASGCAGFISLLSLAGGILSSSTEQHTVCVMADCRPDGVTFDMETERILGSDHSSAFVVGRQECGFQLLGLDYYSTTRALVPLLEVVKRTVQMIKDLATRLELNLAELGVVIHYPNIFPEAWRMVTRYLRLPHLQAVIDELPERAHCGGSDSVISLSKFHAGEAGRIHLVVNYGLGLHLAVCALREMEAASPSMQARMSQA